MRLSGRALVCAALALAVAPVHAAEDAHGLILLRDKQAGIYTHRSPTDCARGKTELECSQRDTQVEPSIAVNPTDPLNAIAVYQEGRFDGGGAVANGFAVTLDGGKTWAHGHIPGVTAIDGGPYDRASDPVVDFGPDGTAYMNSLVTSEAGPLALSVNVSRDGGRTWSDPTFFADLFANAGITGVDKNWMVVDRGEGPGHHPGRIYVVWNTLLGPGVSPVLYAYSDDEGQTWTGGDAGFPTYLGQGHGVIPLVMPNGDLAVVFSTIAYPPNPNAVSGSSDIAGTKLVVAVAPGAGDLPAGAPLVFTPPTPIATYRGRPIRGQRAGDGLPAAAVAPGSGALYVVWNDARFRTDGVNDIVISRSTDGGTTWSAPARVNPEGRPYLDHFTPMIGVGANGDVQVAYRRRQETADEPSTFSRRVDTIFQVSSDGGTTFSDPLDVSTVDNHMAFAARSRDGAFLGDYDQLAVADPYTYIVRTEPIRVDRGEPARFPPAYHHQRTWVAVLGPPPREPARAPTNEPKVLGRRDLPRTGGARGPSGMAATAVAVVITVFLSRRDRNEPAP